MANGDVLHEIQTLLRDKESPLDSSVAMRLMLAAMSDLLDKVGTDGEKMLEISEKVEKMYPVYGGIVWVSAVLGVSVIALIWSLVTGAAVIVVK